LSDPKGDLRDGKKGDENGRRIEEGGEEDQRVRRFAVQKQRIRTKSRSGESDPVDALIKLLQSPLVIDLLAVGATAALAAITEHRSSRAQGAMDTRGSKKA
jgi:hypothetical protein